MHHLRDGVITVVNSESDSRTSARDISVYVAYICSRDK